MQKEEKTDEHDEKVLITDFETGEQKVVNADKIYCCSSSKPCLKFILAATISLGTTVLGSFLLFSSSTTLVTLGAGLVSSNLTYWVESPSLDGRTKRNKKSNEK